MIDQANNLRDIIKLRTEKEIVQVQQNISARVITVTSGKGGVGKTNFTINLAINLRKQNKRVTIIDADFGLSNIEVLCGVIPKYHFGDVLQGHKNIQEVITNGPLGIKFISGGSGLGELANINESQMALLIEGFKSLDASADVILIDTGAGISNSVINFIKASNETIIITTPEPTSITDAYAIIKTVKDTKTVLPEFKIIVNRVDDYKEGLEIYEKLNKVSTKFLGINLTNLGCIPYDNHLVKAVKKQEPVSISFPNAEVTKAIENISLKLLNMQVKNSDPRDGLLSFVKRLTNIFSN